LPKDWVSQAEAADLRGTTRQAISKLIKRGRLTTIVVGGHTLVSREEVVSFERLAPGRPKGKRRK
jgi:excisionase family DNA binding protein